MFRLTHLLRALAFAGACIVALSSAPVLAAPISVGTGADTVEVLFNWPDTFVADYLVHYGTGPASTIDGYDATQAALADTNLSLTWSNFGTAQDPNYFLDVATYSGGHTGDSATFDFLSAPNNFWAEWIQQDGPWTFGGGASIDILSDGGKIGWVFGNDGVPVPEPTGAFLLVAGAITLKRRSPRRATQLAALVVAASTLALASQTRAADSAAVVPGTLNQGAVKSSLGAGTTYATETNNLGDWPLNTGSSGGMVTAVSLSNPDFNGNSFGGTPKTIIAFGSGGGVTLHFTTPLSPKPGEKDLGIFTAQAINAGTGGFFNANMQAAILVSADNISWFTLTGTPVASPTTYTATSFPLNAPTLAYDFLTLKQAWTDGSPGIAQPNLDPLSIADFTHPMPSDDLFNGSGTNAQRLALAGDTSASDYTMIFGDSGGGNWFDISGSGLSQVNYVRLNGDSSVPISGGIRLDAVFANANAVPEPANIGLLALAGTFCSKRRR
jgi:hypothetical protein